MSCTTLLAGKNATYDGSTMTARNEDSPGGQFTAKKLVVVEPDQQPRKYRSVISHVEIDLPDDPMRYTAMPNAVNDNGIWAAAGVNSANVSMTATETITTNERVLGADPLVEYVPAKDGNPEKPGGIGEEDLVVLTLPYIHSAREGVERLGMLHEKYGTYEMNGIAFQDVNEVWWFETIGGHHWIARRVPDDCYVVMPNQLGIDTFDLNDAYGEKKEYMCSSDLKDFITKNHLDLSLDGKINCRDAFGSHSDSDHVYNTPRAWFMLRYFNPSMKWDGPDAQYKPESDNLPWCLKAERKITVEDFKYALSSHYQGTDYDPYSRHADPVLKGMYRPIGINRNNFLSVVQIRPYVPEEISSIEWIAFGSNVFNALVPVYANADKSPAYYSCTTGKVTTDSFYWANRIIGALTDADYSECMTHVERYQLSVQSKSHYYLNQYDDAYLKDNKLNTEEANQKIADMVEKETYDLLDKVLYTASCRMRNGFNKSDS